MLYRCLKKSFTFVTNHNTVYDIYIICACMSTTLHDVVKNTKQCFLSNRGITICSGRRLLIHAAALTKVEVKISQIQTHLFEPSTV